MIPSLRILPSFFLPLCYLLLAFCRPGPGAGTTGSVGMCSFCFHPSTYIIHIVVLFTQVPSALDNCERALEEANSSFQIWSSRLGFSNVRYSVHVTFWIDR